MDLSDEPVEARVTGMCFGGAADLSLLFHGRPEGRGRDAGQERMADYKVAPLEKRSRFRDPKMLSDLLGRNRGKIFARVLSVPILAGSSVGRVLLSTSDGDVLLSEQLGRYIKGADCAFGTDGNPNNLYTKPHRFEAGAGDKLRSGLFEILRRLNERYEKVRGSRIEMEDFLSVRVPLTEAMDKVGQAHRLVRSVDSHWG